MRSVDNTPTAHSWLHIFRILSLYNNCKTSVRNGNVDNEEKMELLVAYKRCLVDKFKECESERVQVKLAFKEQLLSELAIRYVDSIKEDGLADITRDQLVYDLCGYLLKTRKHVLDCPACALLLKVDSVEELPVDFHACDYTIERSYGKLKLASVDMFKTFREVEIAITECFDKKGDHIFARDSYEVALTKISECNLISVCCSKHDDVLPFLVMEYVQIRFHFEAKS